MTHASNIADILEGDSSLGLAIGVDLFVSDMPEDPDDCVCVYDTGGFEPVRTLDDSADHDDRPTIYRPTIQIRVRGAINGSQDAVTLAGNIMRLLDGIADYDTGAVRYIGVWAIDGPQFISYDDNRRPIYVLNFRMESTA